MMRFAVLVLFIFAFIYPLGVVSAVTDTDPNVYDIPHFIKFEGGETKEEYMKNLLKDLQRRLISAPRSTKYLDKEGNITRKGLEKYKNLAKQHVLKKQKKRFFKYNKNNDKEITLLEFADGHGFDGGNVIDLYNSVKEYGIGASEKHSPIIIKMDATPSKKITARSFLNKSLQSFMDLDLNSDQTLSFEEIGIPSKSGLSDETVEIVANFESYLSLSDDGEKTTLDQISNEVAKAFVVVDYDKNGRVSNKELSRYLRAKAPKQTCDIPTFSDEKSRIYAVAVDDSKATTSVKFNGQFSKFTGYAEVKIEKQEQPINLVLSAVRDVVWSIKGDVGSLESVTVFGPGKNTEISSGVVGVSRKKVNFSSREECWNFKLPHSNFTDYVNKNSIVKARDLLKTLTGQYPHLIRTKSYASKIVIKTTPEIEFSQDISDDLKKAPDGYNTDYWNKFLEWKSAGHKILDFKDIILGSHAFEAKVLPSWAGIAQLEHDGVIRPLNIDYDKRRAVFLLEKDLPEFPGTPNSNPPVFSFIKSDASIEFPDTNNNWYAFNSCIMSREGKVFYGGMDCYISDLSFLEAKGKKLPVIKQPVFVSLPSFIPVLPSYKESIDIKLEVDDVQCKRQYKDEYKQKCTIPDNVVSKTIPKYAVSINPPILGELSWQNNFTLTFTPSEVWSAGGLYTLSLDLDKMGIPKGIYVNDERSAKTKFHAADIVVSAANVEVKGDPYDANIKILTADISSNYPLMDLTINSLHVPTDAVQPDEQIYVADKGYELFGKRYETELPSFEIPDLKRKLKLFVYKREDGLEPTHLYVGQPEGKFQSDNMFSRPFWVSLNETEDENLSKELKQLKAKAEKGDANAQLELGKIYLEGKRLSKSLSKARKWLTMAANKGNIDAYVQLGNLNAQRYLVEYEGLNEAFTWYSKAAEQGHKVAQFKLGEMFSYINRNFHNPEEKLKWYELSAEQGYIPAINALGHTYEYGMGKNIEVGYKRAIEYYQKSADLGDSNVIAGIARMYHLGRGVKKDRKKAYNYAKKSLSLTDRTYKNAHYISCRIIAEILIEEFSSVKDFDTRVILIADKVFKGFPKGYNRMWIANAINDMWDGGNGMPRIAEEIVDRQNQETPELEELKFVTAQIILKDNYYIGDQYEPHARNTAISILEGLLHNGFFDGYVINRLTYLYLSRNQPEKVQHFLERLRIEKYYTLQDLSWARSYFSRYKGRITKEMEMSDDPDVQYEVARRNKRIKDNAENTKKWYRKQIELSPKHAWTYGNFANFLLSIGDYNGAIEYGEKALKLMDYPMARYVTGMAYLVKASQLFKNEETASQVKELIKKARSYGIDKWYIKDHCGEFCPDIVRMIKAYNEHLSEKPI